MKTTARIFVAIMTLLFLSVPMQAQTKRALVIGIGQQEDKSWDKINGDKDVDYVVEMLRDARYRHINTLINDKATKASIVSAFKKLATSCKMGDVVYVHYSGHGQQMMDRHKDEADGKDECWIPYDAYRSPCQEDQGEKHLTDDEVNALLNNIRNKIGDTGKMLVVIDACHSGDGTRGDDGEVVRGVEDVFEAIKAYFVKPTKKEGVSDVTPNKERWITLSACESDQVNIEMKRPVVGKLTYAIYTKVKNGEQDNNEEWFKKLKTFINKNTGSRPQRPVMSGEITRYNIIDFFR